MVKDTLLKRFKINKNKLYVINNFVDKELFNNTANREIKKDYTTLLYMGRFDDNKNIKLILDAVSLLNNYKIKIILVGEGNKEYELRKIIISRSLNANIIPPTENVVTYLNDADICILPSKEESFSLFMLEAGVFKKAFVRTKIGNIEKMFKNNENILFFESGNEKHLAEKIRSLIDDLELRNKIGNNLFKEVSQNYTEEGSIIKLIDVYKSLLFENSNRLRE